MINNDKYFQCKSCNFKCYKKSNYEAHLNTLKHKNNTQFDKLICSCGKSYKHPSGLYRHKKICSFIQQLIQPFNYACVHTYINQFIHSIKF